MTRAFFTAAALLALTALSFFVFPGHTWLYQDTQIYAPILEHLRDPAALARDPVAIHPHVRYTLWDEATQALSLLTGGDYSIALGVQQFALRGLALWGAFLLATAAGLAAPQALAAAAVLGLGAMAAGPQVLTFEYEPVPRGFAMCLLVLACGLAARGRWVWAGTAAAAAMLYHPTTTVPFWIAAAICLVPHARREEHSRIFVPFLTAAGALLIAARFQRGAAEPQLFVGHFDAAMEAILRLRGAYVWVSLWLPACWWQLAIAAAAAGLAWWRLRGGLSADLRVLALALPAVGLLSVPLSWLMLERGRWILAPQVQPARAVLFVLIFAVLLAAAAAFRAPRWWERALWLLPVFAAPLAGAMPAWNGRRMAVAVALALALALAARWRWGLVLCLLPFLAIPHWGGVVNYPRVDTPELRGLSDWARTATPRDSVWLFPGYGRALDPGVFRARALRAVYVDWKSGGQANILSGFGRDWHERYQAADLSRFHARDLGRYRTIGVDYLVVKPAAVPDGAPVLYANSVYAVLAVPASAHAEPGQ